MLLRAAIRIELCREGRFSDSDRQRGATMNDEPTGQGNWTAAERQALRKLIRMGLILLLAIAVAGLLAALLSAALSPV